MALASIDAPPLAPGILASVGLALVPFVKGRCGRPDGIGIRAEGLDETAHRPGELVGT